MNCGNLSKNLMLAACRNSVAAIDADIILFNFDEIDKGECTVTGNVCSEFVMKTGKYGYQYKGHRNSFEATVALNKGTYVNSFDHGLVMRVFDRSQDIKNELIKLAGSKVVAMVRNLDPSNDTTKYEIYGYDNGLVMTDLQFASTDGDGVLASFNLGEDDGVHESQLPLSFYVTSITATETARTALIYTTPSTSGGGSSNS